MCVRLCVLCAFVCLCASLWRFISHACVCLYVCGVCVCLVMCVCLCVALFVRVWFVLRGCLCGSNQGVCLLSSQLACLFA